MENINLENFNLITFDKDNKDHLEVLKGMIGDEEITSRFTGFLPHLSSSSQYIFKKGFYIEHDNNIVGYIDFGTFNETEEAVYARMAILKEYRNKHLGYGKSSFKEVCNYVFNNYPMVKYIKGRINKNNIASQNMVYSNNGYNDRDDYYVVCNPNVKQK